MKRNVVVVLAIAVVLALAAPLVAFAADYFVYTVDAPPVISATQAPATWYVDRYAPKYFDRQLFDGDNRLRIGISEEDSATGRPPAYSGTFYNTQGRKYDLGNGAGTYVAGDLYISSEWQTQERRSDIWATTEDGAGEISGYPILGFHTGEGFRFFTQDTDQDLSNGYQGGWVVLGFPDGFAYDRWYNLKIALTDNSYCVFIDGELVFTDTLIEGSVAFRDMMLQGYNYGSTYDIYWDNIEAGVAAAPTIDIEKTVDFDGDGAFSASETARPGPATWKLSVENTSQNVLSSVVVTDTAGMSYGPFDLASGETWEVTYTTSVTVDTVNVASVQASAPCTTTPVTDSSQATANVSLWPSGRIAGSNRYATGVAISTEHFDSSEYAVVATGRDFADGLAASGLAGAYDAPVLLTDPATLSSGVAAELTRLGVSKVIICGGPNAVSDGVKNAIDSLTGVSVERIGGTNRYETARMLAAKIVEVTGSTPSAVFVARGDQFPDALSVSPLAWANDLPVLLTPTAALSPAAAAYLDAETPELAVIVGGTNAVSLAAETTLKGIVSTVERQKGENRYETAAAVAGWAYDAGLADTWFVGVATGIDFPDALAAGPGAGMRNGVLLLTQKSSTPAATGGFVTAHAADIDTLQVFGGAAVIDNAVLTDLLARAGIAF